MTDTHSFPATDLLRRSTPTPFWADLWVSGRTVRIETNSAEVLERVRKAFPEHGDSRTGAPEILWRLIIEPDAGQETNWPSAPTFTDQGLSLVNVGQYSFIAVDLNARQAVIFLEQRFTKDPVTFERGVLATLHGLMAPCWILPHRSG